MRLLLDEMHAPVVAAELRRLGHDVIAVKERAEMAGSADAELLRVAASDQRAVVTENVKDFAALHKSFLATGNVHAGIVFTHARRFPRRADDYVQTLVTALAAFLSEHDSALDYAWSFVWWLERAAS